MCNSSFSLNDLRLFTFDEIEKVFIQIERNLFENALNRIEEKIDKFALKGINLLEPDKAGTSFYKNLFSVISELKNPDKVTDRPKRIKRKKFLFER